MSCFHSAKAALGIHFESSRQQAVRCSLGDGSTSAPCPDSARSHTGASQAGWRRRLLPPGAARGVPRGSGGAGLGSPPARSPLSRSRCRCARAGSGESAARPFPGSILSRHLLSQPLPRLDPCPGRGTAGGCVSSLLHKRAPRRRPGSGGLFLGAAPGIRWPC